jgi:Na+/melibiose symporter-like transporter
METTVAMKKLKNPPVDYFCYFCCKFFFSILTCTELYYFSAFLTDTAVLSLGIIGTIQIVTTVIDSIFSFFYGALMEGIGRHLPWGQTRSWLVIAPPIATICWAFSMVRVSESEVVSAVVIIVGFVISHVVWSIGECAMNAQTVNMTDDVNQRTQMSLNLGRGTLGSSLVFGIVGGAFLGWFAGSKFVYVYMIVVFGIFYWIGFLLTFWRSKGTEPTREEYERRKAMAAKVAEVSDRSATLGEAYKAVFTCKNGLLMMFGICIGYLSMFLASGLMYYYFAYTLGNPGIMGTFMSLRGLIALLGGVFWVPIMMKLCKNSKKICSLVSGILGLISCFIPWLPMFRTNAMFYVVFSLIFSFFTGASTMVQVGMMSDVGAEISYKTGKNLSAFTVSFMSLPLKVSLLLRSVLITAVLGMTGYVAGMEITAKQVNGFAHGYLLIGVIIGIVANIAILLYNNPEDKVQMMVDANNRAAAEDEAKVAAILAERGEEQ